MRITTYSEAKAMLESVRHLEGMKVKNWESEHGNFTFTDIKRLCQSYLKLAAAHEEGK